MKKFLFVCLVALICVPSGLSAQIVVSQPFSDGMVLQQNSRAAIWGNASPDKTIKVKGSWMKKAESVVADENGFWKAYIPTPSAGYDSHSITITGDGSKVVISDVLIGEVWFASGQSNMEMPLGGWHNCPVEGGPQYILESTNDAIRMYNEPRAQSFEKLSTGSGKWIKANPKDVKAMSAVGYFFAKEMQKMLDVPVAVIHCSYGGARVESWVPEEQMEVWGTEDLSYDGIMKLPETRRPFLAYNAMLMPLAGYTIKGFIWYQGCSNVEYSDTFAERMTWLIGHWRSLFGDEKLPFYMVEIAPYEYPGFRSGKAAPLRAEQHKVAKSVDNCEIVVTNDLVYEHERKNIHPQKKKEVGDRLAHLSLNRDYGRKEIDCYSPEVVKAFYPTSSKDRIGVRLSYCANGLCRTMAIKGLEICGEDGKWYEVEEAYYEFENYLTIMHPDVPHPVAVRYTWGDFVPGNLHNVQGLPVAPFYVRLD